MASKKKKFLRGSPLPDIAFITSYKGREFQQMRKKSETVCQRYRGIITCPRIPPTIAQTGGNSLILAINLLRRESGI